MVSHIWFNFLLPDKITKYHTVSLCTRLLKILVHARIARFSYRSYCNFYNLTLKGKINSTVLVTKGVVSLSIKFGARQHFAGSSTATVLWLLPMGDLSHPFLYLKRYIRQSLLYNILVYIALCVFWRIIS